MLSRSVRCWWLLSVVIAATAAEMAAVRSNRQPALTAGLPPGVIWLVGGLRSFARAPD